MKKISRRSFITAMAAVSAAGVLAACGSSSSSTASSVASSAVSSEATSSAASMDELHYQGRSVRSIVPVGLREETAV